MAPWEAKMSDDNWSRCSKHGWYQDQWECPLCEKGVPCRDQSKLRPVFSAGSSVSHAGKEINERPRMPVRFSSDGFWKDH